MTTFNVLVEVIDLIDADTPEEAVDILVKRLTDAGFDQFGTADAFVSDVDQEGNQQTGEAFDRALADELAKDKR